MNGQRHLKLSMRASSYYFLVTILKLILSLLGDLTCIFLGVYVREKLLLESILAGPIFGKKRSNGCDVDLFFIFLG